MVKTVSHDSGLRCVCVVDHRPRPDELHIHHIWPIAEGGPEVEANEVPLCPTAHSNTHEYLRTLKRYRGLVPWQVRRNYSRYCRELVEQGYRRILARTLVG
jgi:HNH endonuclease